MILTKVCWKQELWISESRKKPTLCEECKVSAFFYFLKIHIPEGVRPQCGQPNVNLRQVPAQVNE